MKRLILIVALLAIAVPAHSGWTVSASTHRMIYNNGGAYQAIKALQGFEIQAEKDQIFIYGSIDPLVIIGTTVDMYSAGFGYKYQLSRNIKAYLKVGYDFAEQGNYGWEAVYYYQAEILRGIHTPVRWDNYDAEIDGGFSGEVGVECSKEIIENLFIGLTAGYRVANHTVSTWGWNNGTIKGAAGWVTEEQADFGGYKVGFIASYMF